MTKGARKGGRRQKGGEIMTKGVRMWQFKYDCHLLWHLSVTIHLHQDDLAFENSFLVLSFFPKYWWVAATNQRAVKADQLAGTRTSSSFFLSELNPPIFHSFFYVTQKTSCKQFLAAEQPNVTFPSCFAGKKTRLCLCCRNGHEQKNSFQFV